ncbi:bestrophin, RFP-TM, chloride channel domain-containing protein [Ditylenchus destructor]|nr:bestrophin, RFP-TM, chloride channel domain-containing protein [Ditylenchus destructor]
MTVSYNFDVSSTTWLSSARILFRWRGSMWKAVSSEAITWIILYALINIIIRYQLNETQVRHFGELRDAVCENLSRIPLVFLLGFFVSVVFNRWVAIFNHIGFIDNLALVVAALIRGSDAETKLLRRNVIRYSVLSQVLVFRDISIQVRKRFPDIESIMHSGLLMEKEFEIFQRKEMQDNKYWIPIQWAISLAVKARDDGKIPSDVLLWNIIECNYVIDRNLSTGFEIVELYEQPPCDEYDSFWTMSIPKPRDTWEAAKSTQLPKKKTQPYHGSVADLSFESKPAHSAAYNPTGTHDLISTVGRSIRKRQSRKIVPLQPVPENDSRSRPLFSGAEAVIESRSPSASHERINSMHRLPANKCMGSFLGPPSSSPHSCDVSLSELNPSRLNIDILDEKPVHQLAMSTISVSLPQKLNSPGETDGPELYMEDFPKTNSAWLDTTNDK